VTCRSTRDLIGSRAEGRSNIRDFETNTDVKLRDLFLRARFVVFQPTARRDASDPKDRLWLGPEPVFLEGQV